MSPTRDHSPPGDGLVYPLPKEPPLPGVDMGESAPRPARPRRELDVYLTPVWAVRVLLARVPELQGETLLDPSCGDGRMAQELRGRFRTVLLNDLDPKCALTQSHRDACDPGLWLPAPDWSVTNPPFVAAGDIARAALQHARRGVALLLRATFLEPCAASPRAPRNGRQWLTRRPPTRLIALPRISFTGDGQTDSAGAWWLVWLRGPDRQWIAGTIEVADAQPDQQVLPASEGPPAEGHPQLTPAEDMARRIVAEVHHHEHTGDAALAVRDILLGRI